MDARVETAWTLDECREAVEALRRTVNSPLVREGMDAERVRHLAQQLNGALGVLDAAVRSTPAYQAATRPDGAPRALLGRGGALVSRVCGVEAKERTDGHGD